MLSLQDVRCGQLSLSGAVRSWQHERHCRLHLHRWILRQRQHVLSMQDVLAKSNQSRPLLRLHYIRHVNMHV